MKKLFTTLFLFGGIALGLSAQHCLPVTDTTAISPRQPTGNPGLEPPSDSLAPAVNGSYVSDTIYFENYQDFGTIQVNYLKIDSINNLPEGLCWVTNTPTNTFNGGVTGIIYVQGTTHAVAGQYKLVIYIEGNAGPGNSIPIPVSNAEELTGSSLGGGKPLRYYVRVDCPGAAVQPIDTVRETNLDSIFFAYPDQSGCTTGIKNISNDISNLSVVPNPFSANANIEFYSTVEGTYTVKMTNLLGAVVSSAEKTIVHGQNDITQDRNGLSPGIYLLSISNGQSAITQKVVIE